MGKGDGYGSVVLHKPTYDVNDNILSAGLRYWQALVELNVSIETDRSKVTDLGL
ncbi:MAG: metal-dependent amidase/aminoacylase/carboxypeptidase family protein [Shewanella sp.]